MLLRTVKTNAASNSLRQRTCRIEIHVTFGVWYAGHSMQGNRPRCCDHQRKKPGHSLRSDLPRHSHMGTSSPLFCRGNSRRRQIGGCNLHVVCQPGVRTTSRRDVLQLHRRSDRAQPSTRDRTRPRTQVCVPEGTGYVPGTGYLPCGVRTPGAASYPSQESVTCSLIGRRAEAVAAAMENKAGRHTTVSTSTIIRDADATTEE